MSSIVLYDENLLRNVVREQLSYTPPAATLNEAMLYEGISSGAVKDAIQFVVGAGAEYGLGGLTLPAAGAGPGGGKSAGSSALCRPAGAFQLARCSGAGSLFRPII